MKTNVFNPQRFGFIKPLSEDASSKEIYVHEQLLKHKRWQTAMEIDRELTKEHASQLKVLIMTQKNVNCIIKSLLIVDKCCLST